jgi:hypothetical protein
MVVPQVASLALAGSANSVGFINVSSAPLRFPQGAPGKRVWRRGLRQSEFTQKFIVRKFTLKKNRL